MSREERNPVVAPEASPPGQAGTYSSIHLTVFLKPVGMEVLSLATERLDILAGECYRPHLPSWANCLRAETAFVGIHRA